MKEKHMDALCELARRVGLRFDESAGVLTGERNGYFVCVTPSNSAQNRAAFTVSTAVAKNGAAPDRKALLQLLKPEKTVAGVAVSGYSVTFTAKHGASFASDLQKGEAALASVLAVLRENGYVGCCAACGKADADALGITPAEGVPLCGECRGKLMQAEEAELRAYAEKSENVVAGVIGALLGSLIGAACIVLLSQLGYVALLSGIVMGVCTLKGYELLGGKLTGKGIVISCLIIVLMVYVADRADWAIVVARELDAGYIESFQVIPALLELEVIEMSDYIMSLVQEYLFSLIGAATVIVPAVKKNKKIRKDIKTREI